MQISALCPLGTSVDGFVGQLAVLRDEGFARVWVTQMPYEADAMTMLAVGLREVDTITIATGVVPIQVQHPMLLAQRALTLSLISGGRFTLGIGLSHQVVAEGMWGVPWEKPVRRMSEYLDGLLPLLAGEPANVTGETVSTRGALQIPPTPAPEVYIAALGPQMLRVAGRRSAGTMTWMTGPKTLAAHVGPTLREAASGAGRPSGAVRVAAALPVAVTDDVHEARAQAATLFAMYGQLPSYRAMLDREGVAAPEDLALIGDEATVNERLDELRGAGVDEFIGMAFNPTTEGQTATRAVLRRYAERG